MPDYVKFPVVLLIVTLISASTLSYVNHFAEPRIKAQKEKAEREAETLVFPGEWTAEEHTVSVTGGSAGPDRKTTYKEVHQGGSLVGYIGKGEAPGYSSTIQVLVGINPDFTVKGVKVLFQQETPGLGTRIVEVASDRTWLSMLGLEAPPPSDQSEGERLPGFIRYQLVEDRESHEPRRLGAENLWLTVDEADTGRIEAITGATISSRAVTEAVRKAVVDVRRAVEVRNAGGQEGG